ncbi:MAG: hypothetical protein J7K95_03870 [Thermoplasmata archaeon]|nr:hypothetical protein [Thermoplasmata archaeon]
MKGKVLLVLAIVGVFVMPMIPADSYTTNEEVMNEDVSINVLIAAYGDGGNCSIIIELLSKRGYKIDKIEIDIRDATGGNEKRIINDIKALPHVYINNIDCADFCAVDLNRDSAVRDGNIINIQLKDIKGKTAKVELYTNNGIIYKEIALEYVPPVKVIRPSLPVNTTCIITYPDKEKIERRNDGATGFYFNWVFKPPYPWGWKDADPYTYIKDVHVNRFTGEFDLYCRGIPYTTIKEWCGVADNPPSYARIPPFNCIYGWVTTSVYVKGSTWGYMGQHVDVILLVREYDLNGHYIRDYVKTIFSAWEFSNFDKTVEGGIMIAWRGNSAYWSEVHVYGMSSSGGDPSTASYVHIDKGKFNNLWWFGIRD